MVNVKVLGTGSIGNHLTHACREQGWSVTLCDVDTHALQRTREDIYPSRYGAWDDGVELLEAEHARGREFDLVIIGTPPDSHVPVALAELAEHPPRMLLIEKPLATPAMAGCDELRDAARQAGCRVLVGYNHRLTGHSQIAADWLAEADMGAPLTINALFREHWGGIFAAHPWLSGPADTYLGFTERGGGALGEHSHAINIWQHFATLTGQGRVAEVSAMLDEVAHDGARYDRIAQLSLRCEGGLVGTVVQDVITRPARKWLQVDFANGFLEWQVNVEPGYDLVRQQRPDGTVREQRIAKTRPDDFRGEVAHLGALLAAPERSSPLDLQHGMNTLRVIAAALESSRNGCTVRVDYDAPTPGSSC
jgi:predicted dehydrogenase